MLNKPEDSLRILQVHTCDFGGGAEGSTWDLFQAYHERGLDSWLAVGRKLTKDSDVLVIPNVRKPSRGINSGRNTRCVLTNANL